MATREEIEAAHRDTAGGELWELWNEAANTTFHAQVNARWELIRRHLEAAERVRTGRIR